MDVNKFQRLEEIALYLSVSKAKLLKDIAVIRPELMKVGQNKIRIKLYNPAQIKLILSHYGIEKN